eukprot:CAMPEP_0115856058 /NCGR_PEP_ID=MMETSP0287-20121206/14857_1 /TAXON_ID=412157 /ORGANISM="Chrysochromulina rotalis, Strain UIO044" /LENGTH=267 /DNA_ID=CAMNT_0003310221 /DNA_START=103 /DNA_END=906 /DNA_ORIENTATION=-
MGDARVGKTSLVAQHRRKESVTRYRPTIGADFTSSTTKVDGEVVTLQLWDTAGDPRYVSDDQSFCRSADACMLVFDITRLESFDGINRHKEAFMTNAGLSPDQMANMRWVLVGNKVDNVDARAVKRKRALEWCGAHGNMPYLETSARTAAGVQLAFAMLTQNNEAPSPNRKAASPGHRAGCLRAIRQTFGRTLSRPGSSSRLNRTVSNAGLKESTYKDAAADDVNLHPHPPDLGRSRSDSSSGRFEGGWSSPSIAHQADAYPGLSAL